MKTRVLAAAVLAVPAALLPGGCGGSGSSGSSTGDGGKGGSSGVDASQGGSGSGSGSGAGSSGSSGGASGSSGSSGGSTSGADAASGGHHDGGLPGHAIKTVFVILMENNNWSAVYGQSVAPYINSLVGSSQASWCSSYFDNPSAVHPSEPNYIWLEAASNLGFTTDADPSASHELTAPHLSQLMDAAGISWKAYAEGATAGACPIASTGLYAPKHVPFVFFSDVVGSPPSTTAAHCIDHVVPYSELATDLTSDTVADYNFITPNLCNDMHGAAGCPATNEITQGDTWLSTEVPKIMASAAYKDGGAIFITWDESEGGEFPIGMIALSPQAKGSGYKSTKMYYHSSFVRTVEEVFGLTPLLNDAQNQADLSDLFKSFP